MSRMGDWVLEMQEDFDEFLGIVPNMQTTGEQHGESRTVSECRSTDR